MDYLNAAIHQGRIVGRAAGLVAGGVKDRVAETFEDIHYKALPNKAWEWIKAHPYRTAFFLLCIIVMIHPPLLLGPLGFSAAGPVAGSLAATIQSAIGPVTAGGLFAVLQSAAMGGYGLAAVTTFAGICGVSAILSPAIKQAIGAAVDGSSGALEKLQQMVRDLLEHRHQTASDSDPQTSKEKED